MSIVTPVLPVEVYSIISSEKKKAYPFCRICSISNAHGIIKEHRFWGEVYTFGDRDVIGTLHITRCCHIKI